MRNQRGRFKISMYFINGNPMAVLAIMAKVLVIRAEHMLMNDIIEYAAISPEFRVVPDWELTPYYEVMVETRYDGHGSLLGHEVEFKEVGRGDDVDG